MGASIGCCADPSSAGGNENIDPVTGLDRNQVITYEAWNRLKMDSDKERVKRELKKIFKVMDVDASGEIERQEFYNYFKLMKGLSESEKSEKALKRLFGIFDKD